jgi:hypothetical protein
MIEIAYSSFDFLKRFTSAERAAIRAEAETDDDLADFLMLLECAVEVVNTETTTTDGMDYIVSLALLTRARADEILGG